MWIHQSHGVGVALMCLQLSILEHTGIPVAQQQLSDLTAPGKLLEDSAALEGHDDLALMVNMNGGCECSPFYIRIKGQRHDRFWLLNRAERAHLTPSTLSFPLCCVLYVGFECKFRCSICYNGVDLQWHKVRKRAWQRGSLSCAHAARARTTLVRRMSLTHSLTPSLPFLSLCQSLPPLPCSVSTAACTGVAPCSKETRSSRRASLR